MEEIPMTQINIPDQEKKRLELIQTLENILGIPRTEMLTLLEDVKNTKDKSELDEETLMINNILTVSVDPGLSIVEITQEDISINGDDLDSLRLVYYNKAKSQEEKVVHIYKYKQTEKLNFVVIDNTDIKEAFLEFLESRE